MEPKYCLEEREMLKANPKRCHGPASSQQPWLGRDRSPREGEEV